MALSYTQAIEMLKLVRTQIEAVQGAINQAARNLEDQPRNTLRTLAMVGPEMGHLSEVQALLDVQINAAHMVVTKLEEVKTKVNQTIGN